MPNPSDSGDDFQDREPDDEEQPPPPSCPTSPVAHREQPAGLSAQTLLAHWIDHRPIAPNPALRGQMAAACRALAKGRGDATDAQLLDAVRLHALSRYGPGALAGYLDQARGVAPTGNGNGRSGAKPALSKNMRANYRPEDYL